MSHKRAFKVGKTLTRTTTALASVLCMSAASLGAAHADVALKHSLPTAMVENQPLTLSSKAMRGGLDEVVLDWRTPIQSFTLELAPSNWVESADLVLWADPIDVVGANPQGRDIRVSLNGGDPVPVELDRVGFTARIPLPLEDIRPGTNTVRIALENAPGTCLHAGHGGWTVDLLRSRLETKARPRESAILLDELRAWLARPTTQPIVAGIRTVGEDASAWEALIAQGLALRTHHVPRYALGGDAVRGDVQVIAGTRQALTGMIDDPAVLGGKGARIAIHSGRPLRVIVTGDTEEQVREAADSFATYRIPNARRRIGTPVSFALAGRLDTDRATLRRRTQLSDLGGLDFSANWGAGESTVRFDMDNASSARGMLHLDIERSPLISENSHVDVRLNGRDLGRVGLAELRTRSQIAVPQGWMQGRDNSLSLLPSLTPATPGCAPDLAAAGIAVRKGSRLDILSAPRVAAGDISNLTDGNSPLTDDFGQHTTVAMPASSRQRVHALRLLGQLARSSGGGLVAADYTVDAGTSPTGDILYIGSPSDTTTLPRSLRLALSETGRGGVVGVYPQSDRWIGVMAPEAAGSLGSLANALVGSAWDDLSGGIARVDGDTVEVAHVAFDAGIAAKNRPIFDAPSLRVDAERFSRALEAELDASVLTLADAWQAMEAPPVFRRLTEFGREAGMRGPFAAPRARRVAESDIAPSHLTLRDASGGLRAGFIPALDDLDKAMARNASRIRRRLGLQAKDVRPVSHWADAHFSLMGMVLMLAFALSAFGLLRADSNP